VECNVSFVLVVVHVAAYLHVLSASARLVLSKLRAFRLAGVGSASTRLLRILELGAEKIRYVTVLNPYFDYGTKLNSP